MTPQFQDSPRPAGCSRERSRGLLLLSLQLPFLPSSLHSTPPNTWLGNPRTGPDSACFLPLSGEKGLVAGQAEAELEVSPLLSMRESGHQRGGAGCVTSLVQASLGRAPPLPKSTWTSRRSVSCSQVYARFLSRPGPWTHLPCPAPSHGAPLLRVVASLKSESRAAPCGPPPFLVAFSSPAQSLSCPTWRWALKAIVPALLTGKDTAQETPSCPVHIPR